MIGKAVNFPDEDAQVTIPFDPSLQPATGTIEAWVKVATPQNSDVYVAVTDCDERVSARKLEKQSFWSPRLFRFRPPS